ncbi:MAG: hypothetical protein ACTJFR_06515 [Canibacter sp.]
MIDWLSFITVFVASLGSAAVVVSLYSLGIRFLATPIVVDGEENGPARDEEDDDIDDRRPLWATIGANICFGLSVVAVIVGIFLIIPALHPW